MSRHVNVLVFVLALTGVSAQHHMFLGRPVDAWARDLVGDDAELRKQAKRVMVREKALGASVAFQIVAAEPKAAEICVEILGAIGKDAVPISVKALGSKQLGIRLCAIMGLGSIGSPGRVAIPQLIQLSRDPHWGTRMESAAAMGSIGDDSRIVVTALLTTLQDEEPSVRITSAWALSKLRGRANLSVPFLTESLEDHELAVRIEVAKSMGEVGAVGVSGLRSGLKSKCTLVRLYSARSLAKIGEASAPAIGELSALLLDKHLGPKLAALDAIRAIGPKAKDVRSSIVDMLRTEKDLDVVEKAQQVLRTLEVDRK